MNINATDKKLLEIIVKKIEEHEEFCRQSPTYQRWIKEYKKRKKAGLI